MGELADDLLYHGDVNSALRKLMQDGMCDMNGYRIAGMREMMERLRKKRESIQERGDLLGEDSAKSLEKLSQLTQKMKDAGLIDQSDERLQLTPRGI